LLLHAPPQPPTPHPLLQAGSDSLLTANVFYEMRRRYFENKIDDSK